MSPLRFGTPTSTPVVHAATGPRVLVVDDETRNRQLIEVILGPEGYRLLSAASGTEALAAAAEHRPDLILLDIMMPGIDGYRVLSALKADEVTKAIPVVLVSALTDASTQAHARNLGADGFLTKPFSHADLRGLVGRLLKR